MDDEAEALAEVADALYAHDPEDFTPARAAAAKEHPELKKAIGELRKPTVSAHLVNVLARQDPDLLGSLLELGPALAEAQRSGAGAELRQLSDQRRQLLGAVVQRAVELSGRDASATVRGEVEATLDAGLVDQAVAEAVRSGRLVRPLSFAGFGGVDLEGAVAVHGIAATPTRRTPSGKGAGKPEGKASEKPGGKGTGKPGRAAKEQAAAERKEAAEEDRRARTAAAEQRALEAAGELDDAVRAHDAAAAEHERAVTAAEQAQADVAAAEQALERAREAEVAARHTAQETDTALARAARAVARAQGSAEKARADLDALRRG